ncbi:MAG: methyltransferase domain-containing protein [Dehalococcoidia bacterium]
MTAVDEQRAITLGHPSYVWRSGQERRLRLIRAYAPLTGQAVLDIGCGLGAYVRRFRDFTPRVFGMDVDTPRVVEGARRGTPNLMTAAAESMPFRDGSFDVVVLNEVIEHVQDDRATLREAVRSLRPGGVVVIYAPNRLYPFETHGVYLGRRYVFGNIPLVNYLPDPLRDRFVPHARAYLAPQIRRLLRGLDADLLVHSYVYPGFDNIAARRPAAGALLRRVLYALEHTPLRVFGLSHFVVVRRRGGAAGAGGEPARASAVDDAPRVIV